jgi:DNA-binding GntR family transcriptional regulator
MRLENFNFVNVELLPEKIANALRSAIVEGSLAPGTRLVETELTHQFNVSRIPLREAFRVLEGEGLINIIPHRGAVVSLLRDDEIVELFKVRALFESFAVECLTENPDAEVFKKLETIIAQMRLAVSSEDVSSYYSLAAEFHAALIAEARNTVLTNQYGQIKGKLSRYQAALSRLPDSPKKSIAEHSKIVRYIKAGDKALAAQATKQHIEDLINRYLNSRIKEIKIDTSSVGKSTKNKIALAQV